MGKFDDKQTKELLASFFEAAFASICRDAQAYQKLKNHEAGFRMSNGVSFLVDETMKSAERVAVDSIVSKMGPLLGHYSEIADAVWGLAAKHFSEGGEPSDDGLVSNCLGRLDDLTKKSVRFVHPAYNVAVSEGVKEIRIGPISIRAGLNVATELSNQIKSIPFGFEHPPGYQTEGGLSYNVAETMWDIEISSSSAARYEHASWLTGIATSLIRFVVERGGVGPLPPGRSDIENMPFRCHETSNHHIVIGPNQTFNLGGGKAGRRYDLGRAAKRSLEHKSIAERVDLIFNPPDKSLAQRFSQGLGWLAKGRQASDRSERFLFFFTALEALLSSDDKTSPVVQTVARHAAVLWTNDISGRIGISQKVKKLYAMRSGLVHAGSRSATYEATTEIHDIAENVFFAVWSTTDLKMRHETFYKKTADASYGLPFFED
jgi:Apea-like HEPN